MRCVWWGDMEGLCLGGDRLLRYVTFIFIIVSLVLFIGARTDEGGDVGGL